MQRLWNELSAEERAAHINVDMQAVVEASQLGTAAIVEAAMVSFANDYRGIRDPQLRDSVMRNIETRGGTVDPDRSGEKMPSPRKTSGVGGFFRKLLPGFHP